MEPQIYVYVIGSVLVALLAISEGLGLAPTEANGIIDLVFKFLVKLNEQRTNGGEVRSY